MKCVVNGKERTRWQIGGLFLFHSLKHTSYTRRDSLTVNHSLADAYTHTHDSIFIHGDWQTDRGPKAEWLNIPLARQVNAACACVSSEEIFDLNRNCTGTRGADIQCILARSPTSALQLLEKNNFCCCFFVCFF